MKVKILLCATVSLLLLCGTARHSQSNISAPNITVVPTIPQGAFEEIILEYDYITDEEIYQIYTSDTAYWNEVDRQMCAD
uniref:hypothetical protein n=1 Tax=Bacteroides fragilis TaxID=817 RepID=UPI00356A4012